jgi:hypothetical protein
MATKASVVATGQMYVSLVSFLLPAVLVILKAALGYTLTCVVCINVYRRYIHSRFPSALLITLPNRGVAYITPLYSPAASLDALPP